MLAKIMTTRKQQYGTVLQWVFILGVYTYTIMSVYTSGQMRFLYLLLAFIPLLLLGWGLSLLLSGRIVREISKHLTDEERAESARLARSYGDKIGVYVAIPALLCGWLFAFWGVRSALPYVGIFCLFMLLASPFMFRHWKQMRTFMLSTEYAKRQGYNKESANIRLQIDEANAPRL